jgi:hypothetical protein
MSLTRRALLASALLPLTPLHYSIHEETAVACTCTPDEIPADQDLNDYLTTGWYIQSDSNEGSAWANYPPLSTGSQRAGWLEVVANERFTWQRYTEYSSGIRQLAPRVWQRHYNPSRTPPWTEWSQVSGMPAWHQAATAGMGWEGSTPDPIPPASKWGLALKDFQVTMRFQVKSTAAITSNAAGSFVGNVPIGSITDSRFRPSTDVTVPVNVLGKATCWALIRPNGDYMLTHTSAPSTTFGVGSEFEFASSYSIGADD